MSFAMVGILGLVVMVILFLIRIPVAYAMMIVGVGGFWILVSPEAGVGLLGLDVFTQSSAYGITVIPMFILAGSIAFSAGLGDRIFKAAYAVAGRLPGSLCIAATVACAGFGAICGSSAATSAAMGRVALPAMRKYHYDDALATGSIAAAGTLAVMIPPSTVFIVYAILTEQSVGKLFIAGILPGILLTILLSLAVLFVSLRRPNLAPAAPRMSGKEILSGISGVLETFILFVLVIGGLSFGWFSPTQAGGILVAGVVIIALARRSIGTEGFVNALKDSARLSSMIILIIVAALIFGRFMSVSRIPQALAVFLSGVDNKWITLVAIMLVYMIGGCFMDGLALVTIFMPIIYPAIQAVGFDPIWFGVVLCSMGEMGMITPPVGINVYVIKGIAADVSLGTVFRGVIPFIIAIVIFLVFLVIFPQISLYLPSFMSY